MLEVRAFMIWSESVNRTDDCINVTFVPPKVGVRVVGSFEVPLDLDLLGE